MRMIEIIDQQLKQFGENQHKQSPNKLDSFQKVQKFNDVHSIKMHLVFQASNFVGYNASWTNMTTQSHDNEP